jgi:hypothetical protein
MNYKQLMKHTLHILLLSAALMLNASRPVTGQTTGDSLQTVGNDFKDNTYFAVGLNVGLLSGAGLAGRASFPGGFAVQLAFLPVSVPGEKYTTHFNIGGEGQYAFSQSNTGRLYGLLGMGYYGTWSERADLKGNVIENPFRIGLGIGYEYFTTPNFVIALSGAITYFPSTSEFFPLPEFGMFYYFR